LIVERALLLLKAKLRNIAGSFSEEFVIITSKNTGRVINVLVLEISPYDFLLDIGGLNIPEFCTTVV